MLNPYPYLGIHRYHRYNAPKTTVLVLLNDITILCLIVNPYILYTVPDDSRQVCPIRQRSENNASRDPATAPLTPAKFRSLFRQNTRDSELDPKAKIADFLGAFPGLILPIHILKEYY